MFFPILFINPKNVTFPIKYDNFLIVKFLIVRVFLHVIFIEKNFILTILNSNFLIHLMLFIRNYDFHLSLLIIVLTIVNIFPIEKRNFVLEPIIFPMIITSCKILNFHVSIKNFLLVIIQLFRSIEIFNSLRNH